MFLRDNIFKKSTFEDLQQILLQRERKSGYNAFEHAFYLLDFLTHVNVNKDEKSEKGFFAGPTKDSKEQKNLFQTKFDPRLKWRSQPVNQNETKTLYESKGPTVPRLESGYFVEDMIKETQTKDNAFKFPILSQKSTDEDKDRLYEKFKNAKSAQPKTEQT